MCVSDSWLPIPVVCELKPLVFLYRLTGAQSKSWREGSISIKRFSILRSVVIFGQYVPTLFFFALQTFWKSKHQGLARKSDYSKWNHHGSHQHSSPSTLVVFFKAIDPMQAKGLCYSKTISEKDNADAPSSKLESTHLGSLMKRICWLHWGLEMSSHPWEWSSKCDTEVKLMAYDEWAQPLVFLSPEFTHNCKLGSLFLATGISQERQVVPQPKFILKKEKKRRRKS